MRNGAYTTAAFWLANNGKTVDQLWADSWTVFGHLWTSPEFVCD
ncbi:hypothetical protein ACVWYN_003599 [Pedobacter sp. UYP24]